MVFTQRKFFITILIICLVRVWLISDLDLLAVGDARHDDQLFVNHAKSFYKLSWFGNYHNLTLAKGPFYPIYLSLNYWLGIPLLISETLVYLGACLLVIMLLRKTFNNDYLLIALFIFIAFNPIAYSTSLRRIIREGIYPAMGMLTLISFIKVYVMDPAGIQDKRKWIWLSGIFLSGFWLTKEDGIWIMPSLILIAFYALGYHYFKFRKISFPILTSIAAPFLILFLVITVFSLINKLVYKTYDTVDMKSSEFTGAYGALTRVKPAKELPFVPVTKETRQKLYKVIPSFAELEDTEDSVFAKWNVHNVYCETIPETCGEIGGGWFVWALRDAVAAKGYYKNGQTANEYYKRLAREINASCESGKLDCYPERNSLAPPLKSYYAGPFLKEFLNAWKYTSGYEGFSMESGESSGLPRDRFRFEEISNTKLASDSLRSKHDFSQSAYSAKAAVLSGIGFIYQLIVPILFYISLACIALIVFISIKTKKLSLPAMIIAILMVAIVCRIAILALVHVTSFPAIGTLYLSPVYPLLLIVIFLAIWEAFLIVRKK